MINLNEDIFLTSNESIVSQVGLQMSVITILPRSTVLENIRTCLGISRKQFRKNSFYKNYDSNLIHL